MNPLEILITLPIPPILQERIHAVSPRVRITFSPSRVAEAIPVEKWQQTDILFSDNALPDPAKSQRLRWIQLNTTDFSLIRQNPVTQKEGLIITNMSGINAHAVAEYIIMTMLVFSRQYLYSLGQDRLPQEVETRKNLYASTVGIIGYGSIGREVARLLQPFGVTILATKRDVMNPKDTGFSLPGMGDPEGDYFHRLYPMQAIRSMLRECDYVIICLPLTDSTHSLIDTTMINVMKPSTYIVNVCSPEIINRQALLKGIHDRIIAGISYDIPEREVFNEYQGFVKNQNIILTPGIAGFTENYLEKAVDLFIMNIHRYLDGQSLLNQYNVGRGY